MVNACTHTYFQTQLCYETKSSVFTNADNRLHMFTDIYPMRGYFAERQGEREDMQDAHTILDDFSSHVPGLDPTVYDLNS